MYSKAQKEQVPLLRELALAMLREAASTKEVVKTLKDKYGWTLSRAAICSLRKEHNIPMPPRSDAQPAKPRAAAAKPREVEVMHQDPLEALLGKVKAQMEHARIERISIARSGQVEILQSHTYTI